MRRRSLIVMRALALILALSASACGHAPQTALDTPICTPLAYTAEPDLQRALDSVVDRAVADGFAGQVAVLRGDTFIYRRSAGSADLDGAIPVTDQTLYQVASIAKYFTAALVLRADEEGRLEVDAPFGAFAPGTRIAARGATIADLLAHRSGLGSSYAAESQTDPDAALAAIDGIEVDPARIGAFRYSNDGYDLLAIVAERVYGERYEAALRREVLAPACIDRAAFWGEGRLTDPHYRGQPLAQPDSPELSRRNYGMIGSAGLLITAYDLAAYQRALRAGRVLSPASLEELMAPRGAVSLGQAAYGSFLIEHPRLGRVLSARGFEDWGDNAILNDYLDCGVIVAVTTSRGPAEESGRPPFRHQLSEAAEAALEPLCVRAPGSS